MWTITVDNCDQHRQFVEMYHRYELHKRTREDVIRNYEAWMNVPAGSITRRDLAIVSGCLDGSLCDLFVQMSDVDDDFSCECLIFADTVPSKMEIRSDFAALLHKVRNWFINPGGVFASSHGPRWTAPLGMIQQTVEMQTDEFLKLLEEEIRVYDDSPKKRKKRHVDDTHVPDTGNPVA